ncbi:MAG: hypothetical protein H0T42_33075 [Deltaproteobacteria bacterium]|nr:hypothetical protein [Deltaproteobacteria bacterium]
MTARGSLVLAGVVGLTVVAIAVWSLRRGDPESPVAAPPTVRPPAGSSVATAPSPRPPNRVTKVSAAERTEIAERIARAQASRAVAAPAGPALPAAAPAAPALPGETMKKPEDVTTHLLAAMDEVKPFLVECVSRHREAIGPTASIKASLMLDGDPDVGTLISADKLRDLEGKALPAGFDDCVRDTMQSLQLPPLAEGSRFLVEYSFAFGDDEDDGSAGSAR